MLHNGSASFSITRVNPADPLDPRGPLFEWKFRDGHQVTVCVRKSGITTGGHYHRGKDPSKNPERIFIVSGKVQITFFQKNGRKMETNQHLLGSGDSVTIYPGVGHMLKILKKAVILEYRITHFDKQKPDTFPMKI